MSDPGAAPKHIYSSVQEQNSEAFGQQMASILNRAEETGGDVVHIATNIVPDVRSASGLL